MIVVTASWYSAHQSTPTWTWDKKISTIYLAICTQYRSISARQATSFDRIGRSTYGHALTSYIVTRYYTETECILNHFRHSSTTIESWHFANNLVWFLFLADRTNGRAIGTVLRPSSVVCRLSSSVTLCIVAKRCILEQKLLLTAYRKSYMRNRLVPNWMTLTFV